MENSKVIVYMFVDAIFYGKKQKFHVTSAYISSLFESEDFRIMKMHQRDWK